ncbi:flagellar basal body-associated FliL family protein [Polymorphobacter sp.]|uniref:flagellar basal body-associated FliL family protein n=1 Tax=Polymorphobacter sp. TaxID=1909290 RepID=UPI003F70BB07
MANAPSPAADAKAKPAKGKSGVGKMLVLAIGFIAAAAAAGLGAAVGVMKFGGPMLGAAPAAGHGSEAAASPAMPVEYVEIDTAFTTNLVDTGRYLQVRLSVSTLGGKPVVDAIALHKPAIVSAVLAALGDLGETDIASRDAKDQLRVRLKDIINNVLRQRGVAGTVDEVLFVSMVIQ